MELRQLAAESLASIDWANLPVSSEVALWDLGRTLLERSVAETEAPRRELLRTLAIALSLMIGDRVAPKHGFGPEELFNALTVDPLRALASEADVIPALLVRARLIDVAWCNKQATTHDRVDAAIAAYVAHTKETVDRQSAHRWLGRAVALAAALHPRSEPYLELMSEVAELVSKFVQQGADVAAVGTMRVIQEQCDWRSADQMAQLAAHMADEAAKSDNIDWVVSILDTQESWHRGAKKPDAARETRVRIAQVLERHAESHASKNDPMVASRFQTEAVEAWRRVGGAKDEVNRARVRLQEIQRSIPEHFVSVQQTLNLESCAVDAMARVAGKPQREALLALAQLCPLPKKDHMSEAAKARVQGSVVLRLFPQVDVSSTGRTVRRVGASDDEIVEAQVHRDLVFQQRVMALGGVMPAARQVQLEHAFTSDDLLPYTVRNPFVPMGRELSFARGIALGFQGEWDLAAHVLMPQFENALRVLLEARGGVVTTLPKSGEQNEATLNQLFELPQCVDFFGPDEHFELQSFLVMKAGANLRNELAHGLIADGGREADFAYLWWKVLRCVVLSFLLKAERVAATQAAGSDHNE